MPHQCTLQTNTKFYKRGTILVPLDILATMQAFCGYSKGQEYGIFLSAEIDKETLTATVASGVWEMPKQKVTGATIEFVDYASDKTIFNAAVHRHPSGCRNFSGTDWTYVNQDFDVSFIFLDGGETPDGVITIKLGEDSFLHIPADVRCIDNTPGLLSTKLNEAKALALENGATRELFEEKVSATYATAYAPGTTVTQYNYGYGYGGSGWSSGSWGSSWNGNTWNKGNRKKKKAAQRSKWYWR